MRTTDTMSTDVREVLLEVYVNDAFYFGDSYWASDDKDVQLEFEITGDIYDLISGSASRELDVQLEVVTMDHVSGRYCSPGEMRVQLEVNGRDNISVCEVKDLQLEMNRNDSISELKSPTLVPEDLSDPAGPSMEEANDQGGLDAKNSPIGLTVGEMTKKMWAIFQQICAVFQTNTPKTVGQPEVDLLDLKDPSAPKPEPELDLVDTEQFCIPEPEVDLVVLSEPKMDLVDLEESCASPKESTKAMKNKKVHGFVVTKRAEYATVRNMKRTSTFLKNDRSNPVEVSAWPEMDLNVCGQKPKEDLVASPKLKWDLVDSVELYAPGPSILKPRHEWDLATPLDLGAPNPSVLEPEAKVLSELSSLENYVPLNILQLEDRLKQCTLLKQRHVTDVWPRVFIGDEETATDRDILQEMCITHILNAAAPKKDLNYFLGTSYVEDIEGTVNTGSRYYRGLHINYYSLPTTDRHCSDISKCFMSAAKFIDKAVNKPGSKVLICCKQGVDHSATLFLAYLMICHDMMVEDAIDHVIKWRRIQPSRDFLKKLMLLNADLVNKRKLKLEDIKKG
ncbi:uncharacterized protein LOC128022852 [Carassius gibelio]|uniref:uncharacterized protein LOC128022852 n=1 Tax=Carassius gibelio TaxID=101364 RepID=UPI0022790F8D|nr:uncharacterized protein LOC128022852 [Carassius gibelio]